VKPQRRASRRHIILSVAAALAAGTCITAGLSWSTSSEHRVIDDGPVVVTGHGVSVGSHVGNAVQLVATHHRDSTPDHKAVSPVAEAEQAFALAMLKQLGDPGAGNSTGNATENVAVAPASVAITLAMLSGGAKGDTLTEIQRTLRTTGLSPEQQGLGWQALTASWREYAAGHQMAIDSGNAVFTQAGFPLDPGYLTGLRQYYGTGVWQTDFAHQLDSATEAINDWTSEQTHGKITRLFEPGDLSPDTNMELANAVYFKADWDTPFPSYNSADGDFHTATGDTTHARFMTSDPTAATGAVTSDYQAAQLPYAGGRFAATIVMPNNNTPLAGYVAGLTPASLTKITSTLDKPAEITLPRFTTESSNSLSGTLSAMGMPKAFTTGADFTGISQQPLRIQTVRHKVYLQVGEEGTEAAAAAGAGGPGAAPGFPDQLKIRFDHPFLFLIRDTHTGAILFAAEIQHPES
jgi:serpin B